MTNLYEGMLGGDLEDLVLPMISVDEFVSKVGDDAIVFGFYVSDRDGAVDLNRFIQKSPLKILDTEISPAPDQRGFYVVFFEVLLNERLPEVIAELLKEIEPLVMIEKWKMQIRGQDDLIAFSEKALTKYAQVVKKQNDKRAELKANEKPEEEPVEEPTDDEVKPSADSPAEPDEPAEPAKPMAESILDFLTPSNLKNAQVVKGTVILEGRGCRDVYELVAFGEVSAVSSTLSESPMDIDLSSVAKEMRVNRMLGEGWSVTRIGGFTALQRDGSEGMLVLRDRL